MSMNKDQLSLLLYFETCAVDYCGRVNALRMNGTDVEIAKEWDKSGYIKFGRIRSENASAEKGSNWIKMSPEAWADAHEERKKRADRMWKCRTWKTTEED